MHLIEHAMNANNQGVSLFLDGNFHAAEKTLKTSLVTFQHLIKAVSREQPSKKGNKVKKAKSCSLCSSSSSPQRSQPQQEQPEDFQYSCYPLPFLQSNDGFIYNNAISFQTHPSLECNADSIRFALTEESLQLYAGCVILNLALLFHCAANLPGRNSSACLSKAELMYDTLRRLLVRGGYERNPTALILILAAVNNSSQIQFEQCKFDHARKGLLFVAHLIHSSNATNQAAILGDREILGYLSNICFLSTSARAAPAA